MNDILAVLFGVLLGTLATVPGALVIAVSTRQPLDMIDQAMQRAPGGDKRSEKQQIITYNVSSDKVAKDGGTSASYGLRTLRKYAASSPAVAELQEAVLAVALLQLAQVTP